jgi:CubicO group peptidase (beta-lactamase class C family)
VPVLAASGYAGATVRQLLDMRSGIAFSEDYLNPMAEVRLLEQAIGWAPRTVPDLPTTMYDYLVTLRQASPHGGPFRYRSCETDILGWVCEAVGGLRMPELMSAVLWSRLGAENNATIGVDAAGTGMFDGGINACLRDLVRFGSLYLHGGMSMTGEQVVSMSWIADTFDGGIDSRDAFAASPDDNRMPGGMYRNQCWFPYPGNNVLLCLGIHGQMIYVNRAAELVAAKLSSWPLPQDAGKLFPTIAAFDEIAVQLA